MLPVRALALVLACFAPLTTIAQWQWIDQNGQRVFSDKAPPPEIPAKNILRQPGGRPAPAAQPQAASSAPAAAAPRLSGRDPALEARRKEAEAAAAAKKKQQEEQAVVAEQTRQAARAESCSRARQAKANFDSGIRISRVNANGEREVLDDQQRAAEVRQLEGVIARDCS